MDKEKLIAEAKEIIKRFLKFYKRISRELYCQEFQNLLKDAEKFLSEVENENSKRENNN